MNSKKLRTLGLALIAGLSVFGSAQAATIYDNETITQIAVGTAYAGDVVIRLQGHGTMSKPACSTDGTWSLRFDATTEAGKQAYSMALLAQSSGALVSVSGEGSCISNVQELRWIRLK